MQENNFTETFELARFIQDEDFESLLHRFENDRKPEMIKQNAVMSVEDFLNKTKPHKDPSNELDKVNISTDTKPDDRGGNKLLRDI
jgi:hypothetical protein